jgi:hypothetical protein
VLSYLLAIWKGYRAQYPRAKRLPAILPIVVHHSPTGWTAPIAFEIDQPYCTPFEVVHVPGRWARSRPSRSACGACTFYHRPTA